MRALAGRIRQERGLTLIELLVSMAILGTVMTAVVVLFSSSTRAETSLDARFQAQVQLNTALGKLRRESHNACGVANGFTTSSITLDMPTGNPPPQPPATPCSAPTTITWCTLALGLPQPRYALYRVAGATCTTTGAKKYADYITSNAVFTSYTALNPANSVLALLHVNFRVDVQPTKAPGPYIIDDDIVLRNSAG